MAHIESVEAEPNLVPFIDVMSCLVAFLLLTAAWTGVAQLKAKQRPVGEAEEVAAAAPAPGIVITEDALLVGGPGERERIEGHDWEALGYVLSSLAARGLRGTIDVGADPGVAYQDVVTVMDLAIEHGFDDVRYGVPR